MADIANEAGVKINDNLVVAASRLAAYLWGEAWRHAPQVLAGDDEALHQMRVALRRLRSLLENCAAVPEESLRGDIAREMRAARGGLGHLGDALGAVRDFDVLGQYLRDYASEELKAEVDSNESLQAFALYLQARREENFAPMCKRIEKAERERKKRPSDRETFARWAHSLAGVRGPEASLSQAAPQVLALRVEQALEMGHVLHSEDEEEQHELRKNLRRLRYTLEAFAPAFEKPKLLAPVSTGLTVKAQKEAAKGRTKPLVKVLVSMQDVLGEMQDRSVLRAMLLDCFNEKSVEDLPDGAREFGEFGDRRRATLLEEMRATWAEHENSGFWNEMKNV
jgi:CHAD domain-containing protein